MRNESTRTTRTATSKHDWALVLAGGSGRRLAHLTRDASGVSVPKQFCSVGPGASLLHMALRRAAGVASPARTLVAVTQDHEKWWRNLREFLPAENLIVQPTQRGTGTGILHPLLEIVRRDPDAAVAILPSDHYFGNEQSLAAGLQMAMARTHEFSRQILLLGFEPDEPAPDLGYIVPVFPVELDPCGVRRFAEKPDTFGARTLIGQGALWNSFILAADASALLGLFEMRYSAVVSRLRSFLLTSLPPAQRQGELVQLFDALPSIDFSEDILAKSIDALRVLRLPACGWSDLGAPARLDRTLSRHRADIARAAVASPNARGHVDLATRCTDMTVPASQTTKLERGADESNNSGEADADSPMQLSRFAGRENYNRGMGS